MRLTVFTDYSLRVLIYAAVDRDRLVTIDDIARAYGISKNHLRKVVHDLSQRGYLDTVQGRSGGVRLSRPAAEINVADVVRDTEQDFPLVECLGAGEGACRIAPACVLRTAVSEALQAFLAALARYTIADLTRPRHALGTLLGVSLLPAQPAIGSDERGNRVRHVAASRRGQRPAVRRIAARR